MPPAPGLSLALPDGTVFPAMCVALDGDVECNLGTAFVNLRMKLAVSVDERARQPVKDEPKLGTPVTGVIEIPQNPRSTITACEFISYGPGGKVLRRFDTTNLAVDDIEQNKKLKASEDSVLEKLRKAGHSELIKEELVGGRMYTGPCYAKYNAVLRAKSKVMEWARTPISPGSLSVVNFSLTSPGIMGSCAHIGRTPV